MCVSCREGKKKKSHNDWHLFDPSLVCTGAPRLSFFLSLCLRVLAHQVVNGNESEQDPAPAGRGRERQRRPKRQVEWLVEEKRGHLAAEKTPESAGPVVVWCRRHQRMPGNKETGVKGRALLKGTGAEAAAVESPNTATF